MAQLSRPYQVALAAVLLFAVLWFVVLKQHHESSTVTPSAPSKPASASTAKSSVVAQEKAAAKPTHVYKGAAPGVEGLTRDVRRAHEAVGDSQRNARETQRAERAATGTGASHAGSTSATTHASGTQASSKSSSASAKSSDSSVSSAAKEITSAGSRAEAVSKELKEGKTVLLLFWNPSSSADIEVHKQVRAVAKSLGHKVAAEYAKASEVGSFGTVTRDVTVNETPTLLVINRKGLVSTITGLTDAFSIEQVVREAREASA